MVFCVEVFIYIFGRSIFCSVYLEGIVLLGFLSDLWIIGEFGSKLSGIVSGGVVGFVFFSFTIKLWRRL